MGNMWWGYIHTNNSIQVKRYFSELDIKEAIDSPFVKEVFGPFISNDRQDAIDKVEFLRTRS